MGLKMTILVTVVIFGVHFSKIALGQWTTPWSSCSTTCGHGTRSRYYYSSSESEDCNDSCLNGGTIRSNQCDCPAGTTGTCCDDIPECASNPCQNGGACIEMINRYDCNCTRRYTGPNCENDLLWEHYSACQFEFKRCFRVFQHPLDWKGAKDFCARRNGHLAVVDTTEKQYFLETSLKTLEIDEDRSEFWIGASSTEHVLQWITGDVVVSSRWVPGVGNNIHGFGCLALNTHYNFMWNELYCATPAFFICEESITVRSFLGQSL
ncbi:hypothetical protein ACJMK2_011636 [Sinanodonta woodiana]|uniref:Uncharacterized protein n=1 Tax=Sinanodonta woodiana TaxID=1069815 RepID=A0ABD3V8R4_SINWO